MITRQECVDKLNESELYNMISDQVMLPLSQFIDSNDFAIAGGFLRDIICDKEIRDVDIFFINVESYVTAQKLFDGKNTPLKETSGEYSGEDTRAWDTNPISRCCEVDSLGTKLNFILLNTPNDLDKSALIFSVERCMLGICQIGMSIKNNSRWLHIPDNFLKDINNKSLTVYVAEPKDRVITYLDKIKLKFPSYKVDLNDIVELSVDEKNKDENITTLSKQVIKINDKIKFRSGGVGTVLGINWENCGERVQLIVAYGGRRVPIRYFINVRNDGYLHCIGKHSDYDIYIEDIPKETEKIYSFHTPYGSDKLKEFLELQRRFGESMPVWDTLDSGRVYEEYTELLGGILND